MLFPIRQLGSGGVVTSDDFPSYDLQPNQVSIAENVTFRDGKVFKKMGWTEVLGGYAVGQLQGTDELYWFDSFTDINGIFMVFGASDGVNGTIYTSEDGATLVPAETYESNGVTPLVLGSSTDWQMEVFGPYLIVNNGNDAPMYNFGYAAGVLKFKPLPGWGAAFSPMHPVKVIRTYKNFLLALGVATEPYTVYWSDLGTVEDLPTSWDYADPTKSAGFNPLQTDDGAVTDGFHLNDRFMVYQEDAATSMEIVEGAGIFQFRRLFDYGISAIRAVKSFDNYHFMVSRKAIYVHDGSSIVRPADSKVQARFAAEVDDYSKVFVHADPLKHEINIAYPLTGSSWPNRLLVFNWKDGTWAFENPEQEIRCLNTGSTPVTATVWNDLVMAWGALAGSWSDFGVLLRNNQNYQCSGTIFASRGDSFQRGGSEYYAYIQRGYLDLDELTQNAQTRKMLRAAYLQIQGNANIHVQFGTSDTPYDSVTWETENELDLSSGGKIEKIDLRLEGRYLHWRLGSWAGTVEAGSWKLSGMDLDIQMQGVR